MNAAMIDRRSVLAGLGSAAGLLGGAGLGRAADSAAVTVGVLTDMSGPYADSGGPGSVLAARMAVEDVGPVLGRPVEVVQGDTENKPDVAGSIARRWYDAGVDAIVDLPVSPVALAVQSVAREKARTVMIAAAAISELTSRNCSPTSTHWADDTHALAAGAPAEIVRAGGKSWFFIAVDYGFGAALQRDAAAVIEANGGRVLGGVRFPIGTSDFSSFVLQAQASGAQVVGLAAVGHELVDLVKQAREFGVGQDGAQRLASFLIYLTEVRALGLDVAQGFTFSSGFYWDQGDIARAWSARFLARHGVMPTRAQAAVYAATRHFLKAVAATGTRDAVAVNRAMQAAPVDYLGRPASIRADGRVIYDVDVYRVKSPSLSRSEWDLYEQQGTIPAAAAFLPIDPACSS